MGEFQGFFDEIVRGNNQSYFLMLVGILLIIGALRLWVFGRIKFTDEDFPELRFSIGLAMLETIIVIALYYCLSVK